MKELVCERERIKEQLRMRVSVCESAKVGACVCRQTFFENWFLCHNSMPPHVRTFKSLFKRNETRERDGERWRERERERERERGVLERWRRHNKNP